LSKKIRKVTKDIAEQIRNKYVQGIETSTGERKYFTIEALAIEFRVAKSTLYKYAQKEEWKQQQERFQREYLQKLDAERQDFLVEESKQFDSNALRIAKILMNEVGLAINENNQKRINNAGETFTPIMLQQLANASLQAQKLGKLALGETTENLKLNAEISETDAFREAMELLDTVAESRRESNDQSVH
tara:strand:- start:500 stop:1066 length:567 start_codon:yes stop_codon:yes gene_type:complete